MIKKANKKTKVLDLKNEMITKAKKQGALRPAVRAPAHHGPRHDRVREASRARRPGLNFLDKRFCQHFDYFDDQANLAESDLVYTTTLMGGGTEDFKDKQVDH